MKTKVLLVGGFRKTKALTKSLIKKGYKVTIINDSQQQCHTLAEIEGAKVICGDGTIPSVLLDAGVSACKIAIALTPKDEDNLVICELCKKRFGVKKTISLVGDPSKTDFFHKMGIDSAICAMDKITAIIEQQATVDMMCESITVGDGRVSITEVKIENNSPIVGKKLCEINFPNEVVIGCILRGDDSMIPRGDTKILVGDTLILIAEKGNEEKALKIIQGEK